MSRTITVIRRLVEAQSAADQSDRQLLERFTRQRDEAAFAVLVRRHGPMVLGVCRRVLRHRHDAEDAFQAAFLVLARKAASAHWQDSVGGWLFQVAYHLALRMRARGSRQRTCALPEVAAPGPVAGQPDGELGALLDNELSRLPEKYRTALLLCYYEGKTRAEVARQLGCKEGTVKIRLERGRAMLRERLRRRGLALLPLLARPLPAESAAPTALVDATVASARLFAVGTLPAAAASSAAVALAEGALRTMRITRLTFTALLVLAASVVSLAVAGWAVAALADAPGPGASAQPQGVRASRSAAGPAAQPKPEKAKDRQLRVLLFAAGPSRDYQFLLNQLVRQAEDKEAELSVHLQTGDREFVSDGPVQVLDKFPGRLSAGDKQKKAADRPGNLAAYNLIIAADPDWTKLTKDQLQLLKKWAAMKGHGLIVVAGPVNTRQLARPDLAAQLQPIRDLLPVEVRDGRLVKPPLDPTRPHALSFPKPEKFLKLDEKGKDPLSGWSEFFYGKPRDDWQTTEDRPRRGIYNPHPVRSIKPAATVYAAVRDPKLRIPVGGKLQDMPYLVAMPYGNGRVIYLGSSETWRLKTFNNEFYERFWSQLVRYAISPGVAR
jgi:RNA polymerase sigma factor (sigma-70 family)